MRTPFQIAAFHKDSVFLERSLLWIEQPSDSNRRGRNRIPAPSAWRVSSFLCEIYLEPIKGAFPGNCGDVGAITLTGVVVEGVSRFLIHPQMIVGLTLLKG